MYNTGQLVDFFVNMLNKEVNNQFYKISPIEIFVQCTILIFI